MESEESVIQSGACAKKPSRQYSSWYHVCYIETGNCKIHRPIMLPSLRVLSTMERQYNITYNGRSLYITPYNKTQLLDDFVIDPIVTSDIIVRHIASCRDQDVSLQLTDLSLHAFPLFSGCQVSERTFDPDKVFEERPFRTSELILIRTVVNVHIAMTCKDQPPRVLSHLAALEVFQLGMMGFQLR